MADSGEAQASQILINVISIKMKIKFSCRMALEYNKQPFTKEIPSSEGHFFIFNEDLVLKAETEGQNFQIIASLYNDKGTRYTSGVIKLLGAQLLKSQGERLSVPISKCLDSDAVCQVQVSQVNSLSKSLLKVNKKESTLSNNGVKKQSPNEIKIVNSQRYVIGQTKSEIHIPISPPKKSFDQFKVRQGPKTQAFKSFSKSPTHKFLNIKYQTAGYQGGHNMSQFPLEEVVSQRPTLAETEVLRQSYLKLKEKYKKEAELLKEQTHQKMLLQANQNNYKLQIIKFKLKCEGLEKDVSSKNQKNKSINLQLIDLQKKDIDCAYLKEQNSGLETKIKLNQDTIQTLVRENEAIKALLTEKQKIKDQEIGSLKNQIQFALGKIEEQKHELDLQSKTRDMIIEGKNHDLNLRIQTINCQKKLIRELEDQAQNKLFDFQKSLNAERSLLEIKNEEHKGKIAVHISQKAELKHRCLALAEQLQKQKTAFTTLEYSKKVLADQNSELYAAIGVYKVMKEKHSSLQKDYKQLEEQISKDRHQLQHNIQNKDVDINDLISRYNDSKERHQKARSQSEQKIKTMILKIHELELTIETTKHNFEKTQRIAEHLTKEVNLLKKTNTAVKQELQTSEKEIVTLQSGSLIKLSKYERQASSFQFIFDKYKIEKEKLEKDNDYLKQKIQKLDDMIVEFKSKQQEWKIRSRHSAEKLQKDQNRFREASMRYQAVIADHQHSSLELGHTIQTLRKEAREFSKTINSNELTTIKHRESTQKLKATIKLGQEKISYLETQIRNKTDDLLSEAEKNRTFEVLLLENQTQLNKVREGSVQDKLNIEKELQVIAMLKQSILKLNNQITQHQKVNQIQAKTREELGILLQLNREELTNELIKNKKKSAEFDRFKEGINDVIRLEFAKILKSPPITQRTERLRESQLSIARSQKSQKERAKPSLDANKITSTLVEKLHQTKNNLWRMIQLNRAFKQQNNKLMQQFQSESNKYEFTKLQMHRDIQLLENEINLLVDDKQVENHSYDNLMVDLNTKMQEKEYVIEEYKAEIEQYNVIISGIKTDFETNNDLNEKKVNTLRSTISELNQRIQYLNLNVACLEDTNHELEEKTLEMENEIISHKELLIKNEKILLDTQQNQEKVTKEIEKIKRQSKYSLEIKEELDIQLNTQKQMKEKYMSMLEEEQKKTNKQNQFIAGLIVQKQAALKNELQKSEEVNSLENTIFVNTQQTQLLREQNQNIKKKNEQFKQQIRTFTKSVKVQQKQLAEQRVKYNRSLQKIKERETDISIKKDYIKDLENQFRELRDKNYQQIKELSSELQDKSTLSFNMNKQLTEKLIKIEGENKKLWEDTVAFKDEIEHLSQQLCLKNDENEDLTIQIRKLEQQKITACQENSSKEFILAERLDQITKLQEQIESQRSSLYNLNTQYEAYQQQYDLSLNQIANDYNFKMQGLTRQNQQQLELLAKENSFNLLKLQPLEQELKKTKIDRKQLEIENLETKAAYESKIKKMEGQRLASILLKNNEIKQLSEQSKSHLSKCNLKQSQNRKISLELEQLKLTAGRTQQFATYNLEQIKNRQKVLGKQIQVLKMKQQHSSNYKQTLLNYLYQNEVEVRKILTNKTQRILETCHKGDSERLSTLLKGLESNIVIAMMAKIESS